MKSNSIFLFSKWGGRGLADDLSKNYDNTGYEPEFVVAVTEVFCSTVLSRLY